MAKLRDGEKRIQLSFTRPEDLLLFEYIQKEAYRCRWDAPTFILASLSSLFKEKMEDYEVERLAEEAAQKVKSRMSPAAAVEPPPDDPPEPEKKPEVPSMEEAQRMAREEIAKLDAIAASMMNKKKGKKTVPPMPE